MAERGRRRARGETPPIPENSITKPPSAELRPGQVDTDSLPDYDVLDPILELYVDRDQGREEIVAAGFDAATVTRVLAMTDTAEYKRRQYPPGTKISAKGFGKDRRLPITNRWREGEEPDGPRAGPGQPPVTSTDGGDRQMVAAGRRQRPRRDRVHALDHDLVDPGHRERGRPAEPEAVARRALRGAHCAVTGASARSFIVPLRSPSSTTSSIGSAATACPSIRALRSRCPAVNPERELHAHGRQMGDVDGDLALRRADGGAQGALPADA